MDLEICRFATFYVSTAISRWERKAYYAGKSSTLNAAATTAHCAMEGKWAPIDAHSINAAAGDFPSYSVYTTAYKYRSFVLGDIGCGP